MSFAFQVANALPNSAAVMLLDAARGAVALPGGCTLYTPQLLLTLPAPTASTGVGTVSLGIPNLAPLKGIGFFTQWAVLDPKGAFANLLSFSNGLQVVIGS